MSAMDGMPDARRLDPIDGLDADARTELARCGGIVPRHVDRDDGGDDAAIPDAMLWRYRRAIGTTMERASAG